MGENVHGPRVDKTAAVVQQRTPEPRLPQAIAQQNVRQEAQLEAVAALPAPEKAVFAAQVRRNEYGEIILVAIPANLEPAEDAFLGTLPRGSISLQGVGSRLAGYLAAGKLFRVTVEEYDPSPPARETGTQSDSATGEGGF